MQAKGPQVRIPKRSNVFSAISEKYSKGRENSFHLKESNNGSLTARSDSGMKSMKDKFQAGGAISGKVTGTAQSMKIGKSDEHSLHFKKPAAL